MTALSGPSGSGKTTLLSIAGGLIEPTRGTTAYDGHSMWQGTGDPRPEVAFVLQVYGLVPILSARENVSVALRARGVKPAEAEELAEAALARFHIADLGDRQVEELSGGQMQRVACARGLVVGAAVLLADEPTSELDEGNRGLVLAELRKEAERGSVVVVATHDPAVVEACDRHYVIDEGRLTDHVAAVDLRQFARPEARIIAEAVPPHFDEEPAPAPAVVPDPGAGPEPEPVAAAPRRAVDSDAAFRRPPTDPSGTSGRQRPEQLCMKRTLRGAWSRRGTLLPLLLLTVVVVAGAVTVIGFAESAGTSPRLAVPLLLLGAVAVPATGRELANARRTEIAIARLRGLQGGELYTLLAVEPLLVLLLGGVLGILLGGVGAWLASLAWVGASAALPGPTAVVAGLAIVAVGLAAVLLGMAGALREPLSQQVSVAARPRLASTGATFASVLILVAAVVAVYRSSVVTSGDPDWVVLAGPALVGLAVGQLVVSLLRLVARLALGRTAQGALPGFLAVRRLARVADAATPVRILVAASVVAALAVTGATDVDDWTDDTARLRAGAPLQVELDTDAVGALRMTRDLDPDGRWLMAAVLVPGQGSVPARRAFLDTEPVRRGRGRLPRGDRCGRGRRPGGPALRGQPHDRHRRHRSGHRARGQRPAVRRGAPPGHGRLHRPARTHLGDHDPAPDHPGRGRGQRHPAAAGLRGRLLDHRAGRGPDPRLGAPLAADRSRLRRGRRSGAGLANGAEHDARGGAGGAHAGRRGLPRAELQPAPARVPGRGRGAPVGAGHRLRHLGRSNRPSSTPPEATNDGPTWSPGSRRCRWSRPTACWRTCRWPPPAPRPPCRPRR